MALFGTSGIRGLYGERVTAGLAADLGAALAAQRKRLALGRDGRATSPLLAHAFAAGALAVGADVEDAGLVPTPTLAFAARRREAGAMITASHNPGPYNGLKFCNPDGSGFSPRESRALEDAVAKRAWRLADWEHVGRLLPRPDAAENHREAIAADVGSLEGLAVAVDPGGGAASLFTPALLRSMGARVTGLHTTPDPRLEARDPEPSEQSLRPLAELVRESGARLGVAHDGDADRVAFLDERGALVPAEHVLVALAREAGAKTIVVPINASSVLADALPGVQVRFTPVGDVFVSDALREGPGDVGGEPSGTFVLPRWSLCPDGPYVAALVARMTAEAGGLRALLGELPRYATLSLKVPLPEAAKARAMRSVASEVRSWEARLSEVDGVRADFEDGWVLVRASGTEPVLRVTAESRAEGRARELLDRGRRVAERAARVEVAR